MQTTTHALGHIMYCLLLRFMTVYYYFIFIYIYIYIYNTIYILYIVYILETITGNE